MYFRNIPLKISLKVLDLIIVDWTVMFIKELKRAIFADFLDFVSFVWIVYWWRCAGFEAIFLNIPI